MLLISEDQNGNGRNCSLAYTEIHCLIFATNPFQCVSRKSLQFFSRKCLHFQKQAWAEVLWLWLLMSRLVAMPKFCPNDWLYNKKTGIQHIDHQPASGTPFSILHYCRPKCGALHFATAVIPVVAHQSQHPTQWCCTTILSSSLTTLKITTSGLPRRSSGNFSMASWIFVANLTS